MFYSHKTKQKFIRKIQFIFFNFPRDELELLSRRRRQLVIIVKFECAGDFTLDNHLILLFVFDYDIYMLFRLINELAL